MATERLLDRPFLEGQMKKKKRENCHFNLSDRIEIESGLNSGTSVRQIAKKMNVSPSSISREITRNSTIRRGACVDKCRLYSTCHIRKVCDYKGCNNQCKSCKKYECTKLCPHFASPQDRCPSKFPVCNACPRKNYSCTFSQRFYRAKKADETATKRGTESRNGFNLTLEQFTKIDEIASPLLKKGQSPRVIVINHPELGICAKTLYTLTECGELSANQFNLRNQLKRRPRKGLRPRKMNREIVSVNKIGRRYEDYLEFIKTYSGPVAQMDTVIGKIDEGACLLTIHLPQPHFQIALILDRHSSASVVEALDKLETALGAELFSKIFPVILTDNGTEFMDIDGMEGSCIVPGGKRTKIFFCEPNHSEQKGACENNHKYIRYIIPKGTSLEPYSQCDINLVMSHINSFARDSLYGATPFAIAKATLPTDFFELIGLSEIPCDDVILTPDLLKK